MLKAWMFRQASLATPRRKSLSELMYFSAFLPDVSSTIFCAIFRRLSCESFKVKVYCIVNMHKPLCEAVTILNNVCHPLYTYSIIRIMYVHIMCQAVPPYTLYLIPYYLYIATHFVSTIQRQAVPPSLGF